MRRNLCSFDTVTETATTGLQGSRRGGESTGLPPMWPGSITRLSVICWFSTLYRAVFLRFSPLLQNQYLI